MAGQAGLQPAVVAAVLLAPVVPRTNVEARRAPRAAQVVEGNARVHPRSRVDRNWTGASGSSKLQAYGPSAACTVRVRVAARALTSLPPTVGVTPGPRSGRVSGPPLSWWPSWPSTRPSTTAFWARSSPRPAQCPRSIRVVGQITHVLGPKRYRCHRLHRPARKSPLEQRETSERKQEKETGGGGVGKRDREKEKRCRPGLGQGSRTGHR